EQDRNLDYRVPSEVVGLAMFPGGERERQKRDQQQRGVAQQILQLELGAVDVEDDAGLPPGGSEDRGNDRGDERDIDGPAYAQFERRDGLADGGDEPVLAEVPKVERDEGKQHQARDKRRRQQQVPRGPEEIDAVQEADEQRRIAERGERAADIGDQDDEEHDHVRVVEPRRVGPDERPRQDHRRAGGAD